MALKHFTVDSFILSSGKHCRLDQKYTSFTQIHNWEVFTTDYEQVKLSSLLEELPISKSKKGDLEEESLLVNISDQQQRSGELEGVEITNEVGSDKTYLGDSDIFISKLGMPKGYIFINTFKGQNLLGSSEFIPYKIKNKNLTKYLKYILLHPKVLEAYASLESGKTPSHKRVNPYEFLKIKVPLIPQGIREQISSQIDPIEQKIKALKAQIVPLDGIINTVFARELNFDEGLYNEFGKGMTAGTQVSKDRTLRVFETSFVELQKSNILRFSTRFHNLPTRSLMSVLNTIPTIYVKDVIASYEKGLQPKYDSDGEIDVVKIANLKNGYIDFSETEKISQSEFDKMAFEKKLRQDDVIICATGKISLGKIDFYDYDVESITTVDNYILRFNDDYDPLFFTYFFRCILGYFQVERDFTGATNQIHLYWEQISNFKIPNISVGDQQRIVEEIKQSLDKQKDIKQEIDKERSKIDRIIESAIRP